MQPYSWGNPFEINDGSRYKMGVYVKNNTTGDIKLVKFGDRRYEDFSQHFDMQRRERYLKRASKIKDKSGKITKDNPLSPNWWSMRYLWGYT